MNEKHNKKYYIIIISILIIVLCIFIKCFYILYNTINKNEQEIFVYKDEYGHNIYYRNKLPDEVLKTKNENLFIISGINENDEEYEYYKQVIENFGINILYRNALRNQYIEEIKEIKQNKQYDYLNRIYIPKEENENYLKYYYTLIDLDGDNKKELILLLDTEKKNLYEEYDNTLIEINELWTYDKNDIIELMSNYYNIRQTAIDGTDAMYLNNDLDIISYQFEPNICYIENFEVNVLKNKKMERVEHLSVGPGPTDIPMYHHNYKKVNYEDYENVIKEYALKNKKNINLDFVEVEVQRIK